MKKTGHRIWYGIAMFLSGLVLLLSVAGIAGIWITERAMANSVVQILDAVGNFTGSLRQAVQGIDTKLESMQESSLSISTAAATLSQNVTDKGLILVLLPEEREQNLAVLSSSLQETVGTVRDTLSTSLAIYDSINRLPFISLPAPSQEQVDKIQSSVGDIQSAVDSLQSDITAFRSGVTGQISKVGTGADLLTSRLSQSRDNLASLDARLAIVQESLDQWQKTALRALALMSFLVTLLLAWVIYSQVEVLRLYIQRWKVSGLKTVTDETPDRTGKIEEETVSETGSGALENPDVDQTTG